MSTPTHGGQEPASFEVDLEQQAIERDRHLAWELFEVSPTHPRIPELARGVLARAPGSTGMVILQAMHHEALGEPERSRTLLQDLLGRRDRQYENALRTLRDLEFGERNFSEAARLGELVLREDPEAGWMDRMDLGSALVHVADPEAGLQIIDDAVELCGRLDPSGLGDAIAERAARFFSLGASPARFVPAAEAAIRQDPSNATIATVLAFAYLYDYRPQESQALLRRVLSEDPTDEVAQLGLTLAEKFVTPLEEGTVTLEELRAEGAGEIIWRLLRDVSFGTGTESALEELRAVMPADLERTLRPGLDRAAARSSQGEAPLLRWHDGQQPGTGALWGEGAWPAAPGPFRLLSGAEVAATEAAIETDRNAWSHWDPDSEYYTFIATDDAGAYAYEGRSGRFMVRGADGGTRDIAESVADWLWDRVVAFGGQERRPGK